MQINQHNYEEFFLMYVDNELSVQEKEMVDAFLNQHPELTGELELLKQTVADIHESVHFTAKEKLMKRSDLTEEDLLTYLDGEAGSELAGKIEQETKSNDTLKLELETLDKLYLKADLSVQYPAKEKLYKQAIVKRMDWRKLAIAASLLLCISTWLVLNQSEQGEAEDSRIAVNTPSGSQTSEPRPLIVDTSKPEDTGVVQETISAEDPQGNTRWQHRPPVSAGDRVKKQVIAAVEAVTAKAGTVATHAAEHKGDGTKIDPPASSLAPVQVAIEPITKSSSVEQPSNQVAAATEPVKEKKSLLKKIGKQIGDRALDILSDGSDHINVAGFAIRVEK